jgi:hypothetical protein
VKKKRPRRYGAPLIASASHYIIASSGVNCQEGNGFWMEINMPDTLAVPRATDRQRVWFDAWMYYWNGSAWQYGKVTTGWLSGVLDPGLGSILGGNTYWTRQGTTFTTWNSPYLNQGYYYWYMRLYWQSNGQYQDYVPQHNNANGETRFCDFVT